MSRARRILLTAALILGACRAKPDSTMTLPVDQPAATPARGDEPPVPLNAHTPADYPPALLSQRIGGTVLLRLFLSDSGTVVPESTRVQESSGYPALDSAALAAVPRLRYAPALRDGRPVASGFLQPFNFRAPGAGPAP